LAAGLATWVVLSAIHLRPLWIVLGTAAVVLVAIGSISDRQGATTLALLMLGLAYAVALIVDSAPLDRGAPVFGAGLLLCSELAHLVPRRRVIEEPGLVGARLLRILAGALLGMAIGSVVLAAATVRLPASAMLTVAGAAAAAAAVWLVGWLSRTSTRR